MPNNIINDGSVARGSRRLTIGSNTYTTDDFSFDNDVKDFERTDENDVPNGQVFTKGRTKGRATLQLLTTSTPLPEFGQSFTEDEGTFWIFKVGRAETKAGETKVPIEFGKQISESVTVS